MDRRFFLKATTSAFVGLSASGCIARHPPLADAPYARAVGYGALVPDTEGLLDLPEGFSYRILSSLGDVMSDGATVPDKADGMGCFDLGDGRLALVRNHELVSTDESGGAFALGFGAKDGVFVPGGTTHVLLDRDSLEVSDQFRSLGGTIRNCSGGITPWGSWLTCEESVTGPGQKYGEGLNKNHGWVFEVPAAQTGLVEPVPLVAMGRFNHEAACVDPATGYVYLTEDREDSVLYRFVPSEPGNLSRGGRLQAMKVEGLTDLRNWTDTSVAVGAVSRVSWVDLEGVEAPEDDLRYQAAAKGASLIARGEGIHMGEGEAFVCSTSGGDAGLGQIFKLSLSASGDDDRLALFFESVSHHQFNFGDNLTVAPNGHLVVCEDQYTASVDNHLRGITADGYAYPIARLNLQTELAGACFSPDGKTLFVNVYAPTKTLAIIGPWDQFNAGLISV
jgi:secreted PhoX family phosphatase